MSSRAKLLIFSLAALNAGAVSAQLPPMGQGVFEDFNRRMQTRQNSIRDEQGKQLLALHAEAEEREANARQLAELAHRGAEIPDSVAEWSHAALSYDIDAWRKEYDVGRREWDIMRDSWLVRRDSLSAREWVIHRAAWFDARDAWVARHGSELRSELKNQR